MAGAGFWVMLGEGWEGWGGPPRGLGKEAAQGGCATGLQKPARAEKLIRKLLFSSIKYRNAASRWAAGRGEEEG